MTSATLERQQTALVNSLRDRLTEAAPTKADLVIETLTEAIQARKKTSVTCRKCGTTNRAEVLDAVAATNAVKLLLEQTEGRPGVAEGEQAETLAIERAIDDLDPTALLNALDAGNTDTVRTALVAAIAQRSDGSAHAHASANG